MSTVKSSGDCPFDHENMTPEDYAQLPAPPGSNGLPFVGKTLEFATNPTAFTAKMRQKYGSPFFADVLGSKMIFFNTPDANRWILTGENQYLRNRWSKPTRTLLGDDSVAVLAGDAHRERRRILNPHFRYSTMEPFIPVIQETIQRHLSDWAAQQTIASAVRNRDLTFEIIMRYIFGEVDGFPLQQLRNDFVTWTKGLISTGINLPFTRYGKALKARERLWATLTELVEQTRQKDDLSECMLKSLFEVRDEDGQALSVATIVDEVQVLLFAGHDTTVSALTNILVQVAQHPEVIQKARDEVTTVDSDNLNSARGLTNYPYLDAIINEGLRMHAPVTGSFRQMTEDRCFAGYRMPEDWVLSVPIAATHRNEDLWEQADSFDPERFLRGEHKDDPYKFIPFGGGTRVCLGMNFALVVMRLVLAEAFLNYKWELLPDQNLDVQILPTPLPKDDGLMYFERRSDSV